MTTAQTPGEHIRIADVHVLLDQLAQVFEPCLDLAELHFIQPGQLQ